MKTKTNKGPEVHELTQIRPAEVSVVTAGANGQPFLVVKRDDKGQAKLEQAAADDAAAKAGDAEAAAKAAAAEVAKVGARMSKATIKQLGEIGTTIGEAAKLLTKAGKALNGLVAEAGKAETKKSDADDGAADDGAADDDSATDDAGAGGGAAASSGSKPAVSDDKVTKLEQTVAELNDTVKKQAEAALKNRRDLASLRRTPGQANGHTPEGSPGKKVAKVEEENVHWPHDLNAEKEAQR